MNASRAVIRSLSTAVPKQAATRDVHQSYVKVKDKYRHFQIDDGLLIHQKGGLMDNVLFFATLGINGVGLVMVGDMLYKMAFNKK